MTKEKKLNFGLILTVYLLGIFMGAVDTGIVTPARTVIQDSLGVDANTGIWMITIYTLAYAASIPVMGKLADRMGRRTIYLLSIFLFGLGSLLCGFSHGMGSFTFLLISRVIQAIGGGGIMPVATAEFGTTFPEEKRGMALGLVGGVYGVANIIGASIGSAVMDIFGTTRWEFIFFVNVPIAVFILIAGFFALPNTREKAESKIDGLGIGLLVVMVLCIMYGLKNIDFFNFVDTLTGTDVYPYLIAFCLLMPLFIFVEHRAEDPVMHLEYFRNKRILITLTVAVITGIVLMGLVFVPQMCENCMKIKTGDGGYFVIILGIFAGIGAPLSGRMTDQRGPKFVLSLGFLATIAGSLFLIFVTTVYPGWITVIISLVLIGTGIGFTMGAPLNYMMLWEVDLRESNSALATLSLVRSLGTVIAPAIMVGFIAHAGAGVSGDLMKLMPTEINVPKLPYAEELNQAMKEQNIKGMPDLTAMTTVKIDLTSAGTGNSDVKIPDSLLTELQNSDVTSVTASARDMAKYMFEEMSPKITAKIYDGVDQGIDGVNTAITKMDTATAKMKKGQAGMTKGISGMTQALAKQDAALAKMRKGRAGIEKGYEGVSSGIAAQKVLHDQLSTVYDYMETAGTAMPPALYASRLPESVKSKLSPAVLTMLEKVYGQQQLKGMIDGFADNITTLTAKADKLRASRNKLDKGIASLTAARAQVAAKRSRLISQKASMTAAIAKIKAGENSTRETLRQMKVLKAAVPGAFKTAEKNYLKDVGSRSGKIENTFQKTLNVGFRQIYAMTAISSAVGLLLLMLYRRKLRKDQ